MPIEQLSDFKFKGIKGKEKMPTVIILTGRLGKNGKAPTTDKIAKICESKGAPCIIVNSEKGVVEKTQSGIVLVGNKNEKLREIYLDNTVVLARRTAINNNASKTFFKKLEELGLPCVNTYDAVNLCEDKLQTTRALQRNKIPVPKTALVSGEDDIDKSVKEVGGKFPIVCKFISGTKGIGVFSVDSRPSLVSTLQAMWNLSPSTEIVMQEKIEADYDLRIHVLGTSDGMGGREYKVIAAMKRLKIEGDFRTNFSLGGEIEAVELDKKTKKIAIESAKAVGCLWAGVDIIIDKNTGDPYVLEVNSSPGTDGIEKATGMNISQIIADFLANKDNWLKPKKISGFREIVTIPGVGSFVAKLDTGNGAASCSLHADTVDEEDGYLIWSMGGETYRNKILGTSRAEVGKNLHIRPIISLDVEFNGANYRKIRFSLVDRTEKSTPVLLNRDFMSLAGIVVDPSEDFILTDRPDGYSPKDAKGNPKAGVVMGDDSDEDNDN